MPRDPAEVSFAKTPRRLNQANSTSGDCPDSRLKTTPHSLSKAIARMLGSLVGIERGAAQELVRGSFRELATSQSASQRAMRHPVAAATAVTKVPQHRSAAVTRHGQSRSVA